MKSTLLDILQCFYLNVYIVRPATPQHLKIDPEATKFFDRSEKIALLDGTICLPGRDVHFPWPSEVLKDNSSLIQPDIRVSHVTAKRMHDALKTGWMLINNLVVMSDRGMLIGERAIQKGNHAGVFSTFTEQTNIQNIVPLIRGKTLRRRLQFSNPTTGDAGLVVVPNPVPLDIKAYDADAAVTASTLNKIGVDPKSSTLATSTTSLMTLRPGRSDYQLPTKNGSVEADEWSVFSSFCVRLSDPDAVTGGEQYRGLYWISPADFIIFTSQECSEEDRAAMLLPATKDSPALSPFDLLQTCTGGQCIAAARQALDASLVSWHLSRM